MREKSDVNTGRAFAERAIQYFDIHPLFKHETADASIEMPNYFALAGGEQLPHKIMLYDKATALIIQTAPNSLGLADALKYYADLLGIIGEDQKALVSLRASEKIYQASHYKILQLIYKLIGNSFSYITKLSDDKLPVACVKNSRSFQVQQYDYVRNL